MIASRSVRWVTIYKTVKAGCALFCSATLALCLLLGGGPHLHDVAVALREHAASGLAVHFADLCLLGSTHHALLLATIALAFDGSITAVEAWALRTGQTWGEWLVVLATSLL